ncbi:hypothetical protein DDY07_07155 [Methylomonas sp. ZR1]|nr:hypothetical protein [Methylomonas sp. ZR1]
MPWMVAMRQYLMPIDIFIPLRFLGVGNCQTAVGGASRNRIDCLVIDLNLKIAAPAQAGAQCLQWIRSAA